MTKKDRALDRASKLRIIMDMPEYKATIGAWIEEAYASALHDMTTAKEPTDFYNSQGAYRAISSLQANFDKVFQEERVALEKLDRTHPQTR